MGEPQRNRSVEVLRVLGATAIVMLHAGGRYAPGRHGVLVLVLSALELAAVPLFFFLAGWGYARSLRSRGDGALARRLRRLGTPLLVWWVVSVLVVKGLAGLVGLGPVRVASTLIYAWPMYSLWFFPAAILLTFACHLALRSNALGPITVAAWALFLASAWVTASSPAWYVAAAGRFTMLEPQFALYKSPLYWAGACLTGAVFGSGALSVDRRRVKAACAGSVATVAGVVAIGLAPAGPALLGPVRGFATTCLFTGLGICLGVLGVADALPRAARALAPLGAASLGVYAIHPLVIEAAVRVAAPHRLQSIVSGFILVPVVIAVSWALAAAGRRIPIIGRHLF